MLKKRGLLVLMLITAVMLFAGCGSDDDNGEGACVTSYKGATRKNCAGGVTKEYCDDHDEQSTSISTTFYEGKTCEELGY